MIEGTPLFMWTLRAPQIDAIRQPALADFETRLIAFIREECAEAVAAMPTDKVDGRVRAALRLARRYGISTEASITLFITLLFQKSPEMLWNPKIAAIIEDASVAPDDKPREMHRRLEAADWAAIDQARSDRLWEYADKE